MQRTEIVSMKDTVSKKQTEMQTISVNRTYSTVTGT